MFWLWLSFGLMYSGCQNYKIREANKSITKVNLSELVPKPPETAQWVEVHGAVVPGSAFTDAKLNYVVLLDPESKAGLYVLLATESELATAKSTATTVRGMVRPRGTTEPYPRNGVPPDARIGNLVLTENDIPPTFWSAELLMFLGFIFLGGGSPNKS